jgi:hypothetical protein
MMTNQWRENPIGMTRRLPWDRFGQDLIISFYDGMSPFSRGFDSCRFPAVKKKIKIIFDFHINPSQGETSNLGLPLQVK